MRRCRWGGRCGRSATRSACRTRPPRPPDDGRGTVRLVGQTAFGTRHAGRVPAAAAGDGPVAGEGAHEPPGSDAALDRGARTTSRSSPASGIPRTTCSPPAIGRPTSTPGAAWGSRRRSAWASRSRAPSLRVFVLDGDGSLLMNLGSLATIGWTRPPNLVLDRVGQRGIRHHRRPGNATAHGADLEAAARAMGASATATRPDRGRRSTPRLRARESSPGPGSSSPRSPSRRRPRSRRSIACSSSSGSWRRSDSRKAATRGGARVSTRRGYGHARRVRQRCRAARRRRGRAPRSPCSTRSA